MAFQVEWIIKARDMFSASAKAIADSMDGINKRIKETNTYLREGPAITRLLETVGGGLIKNVTLPLGLVAGASLNAARKYQTLEAVFQGMLGSKKGADAYLEGLKGMTADLGIDFFKAAEGAQALYTSGVKLKDINPMIKTIGALSAGTGTDFSDIAREFAQINTLGRFSTLNLKTMANMHINVAKAIADYTHMPIEKVNSALQKNAQISSKSFLIVMTHLAKSKQFSSQIVTYQHTLSGSFAMLRQSLDEASLSLGLQINKAFNLSGNMFSLSKTIDILNKKFILANPALMQHVIMWGSVAAAIGPALIALKWAIKLFNLLFILPIRGFITTILSMSRALHMLGIAIRFAFSSPLGWIVTATALLVILFAKTETGKRVFRELRQEMVDSIKAFKQFSDETMKNGFFSTLGNKALEGTKDAISSLKDEYTQLSQLFGSGNVSSVIPVTAGMQSSLLGAGSRRPMSGPLPVSQIMSPNINVPGAVHSKVRVDIHVTKAPGLTVDAKAAQQASKNVSLNVGKNLFGSGVGS